MAERITVFPESSGALHPHDVISTVLRHGGK